MKPEKAVHVSMLHTLIGIFFVAAGLIALFNSRLLLGIWVIALGLLLLYKAFDVFLKQHMSKTGIRVIHYILVATVLVAGMAVLLFEFKLF